MGSMGISEYFLAGGPLMYWIAIVFPGMMSIGIVHAIIAKKWSFIVTLCLAFLPALFGGLGMWVGCITAESAVRAVAPNLQELVLEQGYREAAYPLKFGIACSVLGIVPLIVGEIRRRRKKNPH